MKIVASYPDYTLWQAACPNCDLPLRVLDSAPADLVWCDAEHSCVGECPRCGGDLPVLVWNHDDRQPAIASRPLAAIEVDEILAGMGEPPTCLEELERGGIHLEGAA